MSRLPHIAGIVCCLLLPALRCTGEDKLRVSLSVSKRTIVQPTEKSLAGDEKGRVQALIVVAENLSSHALPEGSLRWTAVVKKVSGGSLKYTGTQTLKPLHSFQSAEIQCGAFEIESRPGATAIERDRIDYELILLHNERETTRTASTANFAALAEKAQPAVADPEPAKVAKIEEDPAANIPKPAGPAPIGAEKMPRQKPALPVAEIVKPADEPPPVPQQVFDFFNLAGKTAPSVK
jgi:hypothetical protein